jgi:hypothetical protein
MATVTIPTTDEHVTITRYGDAQSPYEGVVLAVSASAPWRWTATVLATANRAGRMTPTIMHTDERHARLAKGAR